MTQIEDSKHFDSAPKSIFKYLNINKLNILFSFILSKLFFTSFYFMLKKHDPYIENFDANFFFHTYNVYDTPIHYLSLITLDILIFSFLLRNLILNQNKIGNWIISIIYLIFTFITQIIKFIINNESEEVNIIEEIKYQINYITAESLLFNVAIIALIIQFLIIYFFLTSNKFDFKEILKNNSKENRLQNINIIFKCVLIFGIGLFIYLVTQYGISSQFINLKNTSEYIPKSNIKTVLTFHYKNEYDSSGGIIPIEVMAIPTFNMILSYALKEIVFLLYIVFLIFFSKKMSQWLISEKLKNKLFIRKTSFIHKVLLVIQKTEISNYTITNFYYPITRKFNAIFISISKKTKNILGLIWMLFHLFMLITSKNVFEYRISWNHFWVFTNWTDYSLYWEGYGGKYDITEFIFYVVIPFLLIFIHKYFKGEDFLFFKFKSIEKKSTKDVIINDLKKYKELYDLGVISDEEFSEIKKKLLS